MDLSSLGNLGDLAKQMQDAYTDGTNVMNSAGKEVAKEMEPDYEIEVEIDLSAKIEGHDYKVDATLMFEIELEPVLAAAKSGMGDLSSVLDGLDVDLGNDKDAVMEQLGKPRAIGVVKEVHIDELKVSNDDGEVDTELNVDGTLLATVDGDKLLVNFESALTYPDHTDIYFAVPSMEEMQKNIQLDVKKLEKKEKFSWTEKDKDNLKVKGSIEFRKL